MKKKMIKTVMFLAFIAVFTSCGSINKTMREPNVLVNLEKSDFSLSAQVSAEAKSVKVLGVDWARVFNKKTGRIESGASSSINSASIPVIGNFLMDKTANYSLYELMTKNPGYDVVFYPQYETKVVKPVLGIGFIAKITTVKTTARLGKLNN